MLPPPSNHRARFPVNTITVVIGFAILLFGLLGYARSFWRGSRLRGENPSGGDSASGTSDSDGWSGHHDGGGDAGGHG